MALLILVREIDLSVAAIVALAATGVGYAAEAGHGPLVLIAIAIGIGLLTFGISLNNIPGQVVSVYVGALSIAVIAIPRIIDRLRRDAVSRYR